MEGADSAGITREDGTSTDTDEAVSAPGNVDNEPISASSVAEHSTQSGNVDGKVGGLDEDIRPNASHQFLLTDQLTRAFKQHNQDL